MTFFTRITSAALAGLCVFGAVGTAYAHHLPRQPFVEAETRSLLNAARQSGIQIFTDQGRAAEHCKKGLYGAANTDNQLLICTANHGEDMVELADTIRHELIHSAQFCKGRNRGATQALLYPEDADKFLELARDQLHMPMKSYEPSKYFSEAEARVLAHMLDEHQVADLLKEHCG